MNVADLFVILDIEYIFLYTIYIQAIYGSQ